jgi:hypothetical protein
MTERYTPDIENLSIDELRQLASAEGVPDEDIEDAYGSSSPKDELIRVLTAWAEAKAEYLKSLNVGELRQLASAQGVPATDIENARDGSSPKDDLIDLINKVRVENSPAQTQVQPIPGPVKSPVQTQTQPRPRPHVVPLPLPMLTSYRMPNGLLLGKLQPPTSGIWYDLFVTNALNVNLIRVYDVTIHKN